MCLCHTGLSEKRKTKRNTTSVRGVSYEGVKRRLPLVEQRARQEHSPHNAGVPLALVFYRGNLQHTPTSPGSGPSQERSAEMKWLVPAVSQSQRFGIDTFHTATLSSRICAECGNCPIPFSFSSTALRSLDTSPAGPAPSWVLSKTRPPIPGRQRQRSATTMNVAAGLGNAAVEFATTVTNNGMLLVRGGGGGGIATSSPLCGILLATACLAAVLERCTRAGAVVGAPLLSFGTFCILSNLGLVPPNHPLYDLCWSFLLPLSLSIIILGNPIIASNDKHQRSPDDADLVRVARQTGGRRYITGPMARVGLSYLVGALGSVAGVAAAFSVATSCDVGGSKLALPRDTAARIAGAVAATYIGGSVNLFAVASAVGLMGEAAAGVGGASLLGALAASDIFLMALYFSGLVAASKTPFLRRVFPSAASRSRPDDLSAQENGGEMGAVDPVEIFPARARAEERQSSSFMSGSAAVPTTTLAALLVLGSAICFSGNAVASRSPLPGTSTMATTLLTVGVARLLSRYAPAFHKSLSRAGPLVAAVLLNAFFGSVGASGRWAQVVGVAPAIFAFASVALGVHVVVMTVGVAALNRCCAAGLGIDDMIVASNANIGGPSTAATFAGLIGQDELVVPAAVWGTAGYAVATTIGVGIWTVLR